MEIFGDGQPVVFYADNVRGDAAFLRKVFPSLDVNIHPTRSTSKFSHLKILSLPSNVQLIICETSLQVDNCLSLITESIDGENDEVVGFDTEWNVELIKKWGGYYNWK